MGLRGLRSLRKLIISAETHAYVLGEGQAKHGGGELVWASGGHITTERGNIVGVAKNNFDPQWATQAYR